MSGHFDEALMDHLLSLCSWCDRAIKLASATTFRDLERDEVMQLALAMSVAQIGEVSGRLLKKWPEHMKQNSNLELNRASAMRNRIIHGYDQIDFATLWETVNTSVFVLRKEVGKLIAELQSRAT